MTTETSRSAPSAATKAALDGDVHFDEIEELADKAVSYWRSIAEAAYRRERMTIAVHVYQVRLVTYTAVQILAACRT